MDKMAYKKANKLCRRCNEPLDRDGVYCISCNNEANKKRKSKVNEIHNKGLCVDCKNPLDRKGWFCIACNNKLKLMQKNKIIKRKSEGLCVQCGIRKSVENKVRCQICLDKNKISIRESRKIKKNKG